MKSDDKIRMISSSERGSMIELLKQNPDLNSDDALFSIQKSDITAVYKAETDEVIGCGTFRLWGKSLNKADIYLYVAPTSRNEGIGEKILEFMLNTPELKDLVFVSTKVETNHRLSQKFFQKFSFEPWYTEFILSYCGKIQTDSKLKFEHYQSKYFKRYVNALRNSFYELRKSNDFEPYYCCEANEEKRLELERNKENIFVLMDEENIAASIIVNENTIEDVFVAPEYQGKGIGRDMLCFAVNKAVSKGCHDIQLSAIKWNTKALKLYESIGFKVVKTIDYFRLYNDIEHKSGR